MVAGLGDPVCKFFLVKIFWVYATIFAELLGI